MSEKRIMYKTSGYIKDKIKLVVVVKETALYVTYIENDDWCIPVERREAKKGRIYATWEDARQALMKGAESKIKAARRSLELANAEYGNIKGLKPPKVQDEI